MIVIFPYGIYGYQSQFTSLLCTSSILIIFSSAIYTTAFQKKSIDISVLIGYTVISYME